MARREKGDRVGSGQAHQASEMSALTRQRMSAEEFLFWSEGGGGPLRTRGRRRLRAGVGTRSSCRRSSSPTPCLTAGRNPLRRSDRRESAHRGGGDFANDGTQRPNAQASRLFQPSERSPISNRRSRRASGRSSRAPREWGGGQSYFDGRGGEARPARNQNRSFRPLSAGVRPQKTQARNAARRSFGLCETAPGALKYYAA
jgi:hypothetical protein